jgi:hypothetical protein
LGDSPDDFPSREGKALFAALGMNHISATKGTVTGAVYVKYSFDREKREALERWAAHLSHLLKQAPEI